jgi:hypothetical protein
MQNGSANLAANVGPKATLMFTTLLNRTFTRSTPLSTAIGFSQTAPPMTDVDNGTGLLDRVTNFRQQYTTRALRSSNALNGSATPARWLELGATGGIDVTNRHDLAELARGDCPACYGGDIGRYDTNDGTATTTSVNLRASSPQTLTPWVTLRTSIGANYARTATNNVTRLASDIPQGATSGNGAADQSTYAASDDRSTAGAYLEAMLSVANQFFAQVAVRKDLGSALGRNVAPSYPKTSLSWLVSDAPFFPKTNAFNTLRLRLAFGHSGVQPDIVSKLRTYLEEPGYVDDAIVSTVNITSFGNSVLKPERTTELEGGVDAEFLDSRLTAGLTWYRKRTYDALVNRTVPYSVAGGGTVQENIGTVGNTGAEFTLGGTLLQRPMATWHVDAGISRNRNRLIELGLVKALPVGGAASYGAQFVEGYPLFGRWARPIIGFADVNQDGAITSDEVQLGDSLVYLGAPYPNYEASFQTTLTVFRNINIGATFNYQNGLSQRNGTLFSNNIGRAYNDPTTPLESQAYLAAVGLKTQIGAVQTVSTFRFNAISLGYAVPTRFTKGMLGGRRLSVAVQGTNLGLWTNYRGKDPNVSSVLGDAELADGGALPMPRVWQFSLRID